MCHAFLRDSTFYQSLFRIDQAIAEEVRSAGCRCGGVLHVASYPRKPRGLRGVLDASYNRRLSFCCAGAGCRRRTTPPSVRFLGRKVYLGVIIILITALEHGLSAKRRRLLVETLDIPAQTLSRWRTWWRKHFATSRCWQTEKAHYLPPIQTGQLPGGLLGRLQGADLVERVRRLLVLVAPLSTGSWTGYLRVGEIPQTM